MTSKIVRSPLGRCNHPAAGQTKPGPQKKHHCSAGPVPHHPRRDSERTGPDTSGGLGLSSPDLGKRTIASRAAVMFNITCPPSSVIGPRTGTPSLLFSAHDRHSGWPWPAGFLSRRRGLRTPSRHSWRDCGSQRRALGGRWLGCLGAAWRPCACSWGRRGAAPLLRNCCSGAAQ
jgi:hypothetical protein